MHPVGYLFEDVYRNYWGITRVNAPERRRAPEGATRPGKTMSLMAWRDRSRRHGPSD